MSRTRLEAEAGAAIASEPFAPSTLALDRRNSKLRNLQALRQEYVWAAEEPSTIDYEVDQIRDAIRAKAVDEDFSVALRERWQTWSRTANPFRSELASSAASELRSADRSASESEGPSEDSAAEDSSHDSPNKRKRKRATRGRDTNKRVGKYEADPSEEYESVRRDREALLGDLDAALPNAFRFSERQLKVYAHRLKTRYINSLDRPFEAKDIDRLLRQSKSAPLSGTSLATKAIGTASQPTIFTISFFNSSIDWTKEDAVAREKADPLNSVDETDDDSTRDDYVKRICGDGLGGMKRAQTVELLSTQSLLDLHSSLFCWSDEQPERLDWHKRLRRQANLQVGVQRHPDANAPTYSPLKQGETAMQSDLDGDDDLDHNKDVHFARFTGQPRQTDVALVIEDKLYTKGLRHGDAAYEADYATLLHEWAESTGNADLQAGWTSKGGDLDLPLDQIGTIRVGQPYWLLHQGDCVHCFVVEKVRALRPSEQAGLRQGAVAASIVETAPAGTAFIPFPRVTWLSTPAMLRFAADTKHNWGLGHHILQWEGLLPLSHFAPGAESKLTGGPGSSHGDNFRANPWQIRNLRTRRRDEAMLRQKQGKCLSCSLRKARVGILGGESVRLPLTSADLDEHDSAQGKQIIDGLDEHLIAVCTPCAALLGLPTRPLASTDNSLELDWERIDREKHRQAGWAVFPLY
ncbi:uncharacterized protein SPSC_02370 [Sporisorium scitamineum]|uniref:Uncharacterized protein n=1 Tax=Sporisorium scitamineum TaxID=49012 RepID=A0A0F7RU06_9BASI|nr:hypothetical protein [Sporisorium scitamineum]CDU23741.1 uncharacterized protein SPSC_02370 [Sporisorium scitamineum]